MLNTNYAEYFSEFPETSRLWVFMSNETFTHGMLDTIHAQLKHFLTQWNTHGKNLTSAYEIIDNRFIVIAADESRVAASGCSIDSLSYLIQELEQEVKIVLTNRMLIAYTNGNGIKTDLLPAFKEKLKNNELDTNTYVYDNSVSTVGEFRKRWFSLLNDSWAARFIPKK